MKILHVVPSYYPAIRYGGTILAVHDLSSGLASLGHDVEVFTTNRDGPGTLDVPVGEKVPLDGVRVTYFSANLFPRLYYAPAMKRALAVKIADTDLVFLHSVFLWPTSAAARIARAAGVPYVASPHGMLVKSLIASRNAILKQAWIKAFERKNYERAAAIRVTSSVEKDELERFGWRLPKMLMITNPANQPSPYAEADVADDILDIVKRQPLILYFGRLSWKKGIDRLIESLRATEHGHLAIVGTDDEGLVTQLSAVADAAGVRHRVTFLARTVSGADKEHLFKSATLFVLTSYNENFGNTVLEAMARRVPVLVTPEVGASELVREAEAGVVVEGDPIRIGTAVSALLADPGERARMGTAGESYCRLKCSRTTKATQMSSAIEAIVTSYRTAAGAKSTGGPSKEHFL